MTCPGGGAKEGSDLLCCIPQDETKLFGRNCSISRWIGEVGLALFVLKRQHSGSSVKFFRDSSWKHSASILSRAPFVAEEPTNLEMPLYRITWEPSTLWFNNEYKTGRGGGDKMEKAQPQTVKSSTGAGSRSLIWTSLQSPLSHIWIHCSSPACWVRPLVGRERGPSPAALKAATLIM